MTGCSARTGRTTDMEKVEYFGQPNCLRLSNGTTEVIVTTDIGPRIIRYGFVGADNLLGEVPDTVVQTEHGEWRPWGGHRLWHAPEAIPRTYVPDNTPVEYEALADNSVRLVQPVEGPTGIQKTLTVTLDAEGTRVTVGHKLTNRNAWPVELAVWGLTIMNGSGGGTVIVPQEPYRSHDDYLLPARPMVLWHYSDLSDPRWTFGKRHLRLAVDEAVTEPQKVGVANKQGWAAYAHAGRLFIKRFPYVEGATYPDGGCNCETYTAGSFVEIETIGPMTSLAPGESAEHVERWQVFKDVELGETDDEIDAALKPLLGAEQA